MSVYDQISSNKLKTYIVMMLFIALVAMLAFVFGQASGYGLSYAAFALIISGVITLGSYYFGDSMVLNMSGAKPADPKRDFDFFTVAENLSIAGGIPKPKLYVIDDSAPNAFATGRDPEHATVCVTRGILDQLNRRELEGVIAHELSHVKNYDIRLMSIVAILVGTVAFLADVFMRSMWWGGSRRDDRDDRGNGIFMIIGIVLAIISPFIAMLIQLAISRRREFLADASGVLLTRNPNGLAQALEKISRNKDVLEAATNATAHLYIVNPFKGKNFGAWFAGLFNTHPPIAERIKALRSM